jgi:hypothetical protein
VKLSCSILHTARCDNLNIIVVWKNRTYIIPRIPIDLMKDIIRV